MSLGRRWPDQAWSSQAEGFRRQRWPVPFQNTGSSPYGQALVGRGALEQLCPEDWRSLDGGGRGTLGWRAWGVPRERRLRTLRQRELCGPEWGAGGLGWNRRAQESLAPGLRSPEWDLRPSAAGELPAAHPRARHPPGHALA